MLENAPRSIRDPGLEYLIAHHTTDRFSRTIRVRIRHRTLHFCARCTGQVIGFAAFLGLFFSLPTFQTLVLTPVALVVVAFLPLPAAADWVTQATGARESRNGVRVISGVLLGTAFGCLLALLLTEHWLFLVGGLIVIAGYFLLILAFLKVTGAWRRVLTEHFPDVALPPEV